MSDNNTTVVRLDELRAEFERKLQEKDQRIRELEQQLQEKQVAAQEQAVQELQQKISDLQQQIEDITKQLESEQVRANELDRVANQLKEEKEQLSQQLEEYKAKAAEAEAELKWRDRVARYKEVFPEDSRKDEELRAALMKLDDTAFEQLVATVAKVREVTVKQGDNHTDAQDSSDASDTEDAVAHDAARNLKDAQANTNAAPLPTATSDEDRLVAIGRELVYALRGMKPEE